MRSIHRNNKKSAPIYSRLSSNKQSSVHAWYRFFFGMYLFLFFSGPLSTSIFAQEAKKLEHTMTYRHYTVRDGLSQMQTFRLFQDSYGYIWTVMNGSISRFDGKNFRTYTREDLKIEGFVTYINQYNESVFFTTRDRVSFLHPDGTVTFYDFPDGYKTVPKTTGHSAIMMAGKYLYLANCRKDEEPQVDMHTFYAFDLEHKTFKKIKERPSADQLFISGNQMVMLQYYGDGRCIKVYDMVGDTLALLREDVLDPEKHYNIWESDSENEFFLGETPIDQTGTHIYSYRLSEDGTFTKDFLCESDHPTLFVRRINDHQVFAGTLYHSYLIDEGRRMPFPIPALIANYAMKDRDGNLWLATEEGLVNCYHLFFDSYRLGIKHNDYIWAVRKDCYDQIWFASYGLGFWRADKNGQVTKAKVYDQGKEVTLDLGYMDCDEDASGRLYFTSNRGLVLYDPQKGNRARLDLLEAGVSLAVYFDSISNCVYAGGIAMLENNLWSTNLTRIDKNLKTKLFPMDFPQLHIVCISRDAKRRLRIGTWRGEYIFDEKEEVVVKDTVQQPYRGIISMALDQGGFLWKGTTSGVYAEDPEGKRIAVQETGKEANFIFCYREKYVIWGYADKLAILDLPAFHKDTTDIRIRIFDVHDGFDVLESGQNGDYIDKDGYVWLTVSDNVLRFHPDALMAKPEECVTAPYIAAIYNKDKDHDWSLMRNPDSLIFKHSDNYLRFDFLQASILSPEKLMFRYRLKGYNDKWEMTNEHAVVFQNVIFGKYQLEVQSSVDGVIWSDSTVSPQITIKRPFLLTTYGLLLLAAGILLILFSLAYWVRRLSIRKQQEKQQMDRLRHRAVQSKFIPHFTGNVLNSISHLISKDPLLAQKYIVDFSGFSRQTLLYSEKLQRTLEEELEYIHVYLKLEKLRFEEDLEYSFSIDPAIDRKMMVPMMALQTFCENAIKHGLHHKEEPGTIKIGGSQRDGYVILSVEDDGIGREKACELKTEGSREGLNIITEQINFFNKKSPRKSFLRIIDLYDKSNHPSGTRFELHIPG